MRDIENAVEHPSVMAECPWCGADAYPKEVKDKHSRCAYQCYSCEGRAPWGLSWLSARESWNTQAIRVEITEEEWTDNTYSEYQVEDACKEVWEGMRIRLMEEIYPSLMEEDRVTMARIISENEPE